jgi:hypothetical protein
LLVHDPCPSSWPWPSKVPIAERQRRHTLSHRGRCVSQRIISPRAEILLIRIADAKALTIRDAGRASSIFYTCSVRCLTSGGQDRRLSERPPGAGPPSRVTKDPRQRVCPGSVNLDKVGIITDLNDKHLHQTEALKQSCEPVSCTNQTNADMRLLSIIALRNSATYAAERFTKDLESALCHIRHRRQGTTRSRNTMCWLVCI